jgi:hypothetical protein
MVQKAIGQKVPVPEEILALQEESEPIAVISPDLEAFKGAVASCF